MRGNDHSNTMNAGEKSLRLHTTHAQVGYCRTIELSRPALAPYSYIVIMTLAFLYQVTSGLSPFFVLVSAMSALPAMKSSCVYVRANLPVMAVYMGSMTSKSVGKRMSK